jgi:indole-3-glycerol phosphate synthase
MLDEIIAHKRRELTERQAATPLDEVRRRAEAADPPRDFAGAVKRTNGVRLLAEIKRGSPSRGVLRTDLSPADLARTYEQAGAHALSVLTDARYFLGADEHLLEARAAVALPVLRKDFTLSEYHVYQARAANADAVLLMAQVLSLAELTTLRQLTEGLGMTAFVEGHRPHEIEAAVACGARVIGINNRDLTNLELDLATTERLRGQIPADRIVVAQSGMETPADVRRMVDAGVDAVQIGSSLMASEDVAAKIHDFFST